jgi:hypothetical protein
MRARAREGGSGIKTTYRFSIPRLPSPALSPNARAHWSKVRKAKVADGEDAYASFLSAFPKPSSPFKKASIAVTVYFKASRTRDLDNWNARMIGIWNGLKGWLFVDDSYDCIGQPKFTFIVDKTKAPLMEIVIKEESVDADI